VGKSLRVSPLLSIPSDHPYPAYDRLRAKGPVVTSSSGVVMVSGHAEASQVLRDTRCGRSRLGGKLFSGTVFFTDPPEQRRMRSVMTRAFAPKQIAELADSIQNHVDRLLARAASNGGLEVMADFARPLSVAVVADLVGVPQADHAACGAWAEPLGPTFDVISDGGTESRARPHAEAFGAYLRDHVRRLKEKGPRPELLATMLEALDEGAITEDELVVHILLLFVAGHQTTVDLLGSAVALIEEHPDERRRLIEAPELFEPAVEEVLRFESPVQIIARTALESFELAGVLIPEGRTVWILLGAANRDPRAFAEPHRFDVGRDPNPHLAFAAGVHYCLGAPLARLEGQIALRGLYQAFPRLRLIEPLAWKDLLSFRGRERVRVEV
jgi:cytochrome P450